MSDLIDRQAAIDAISCDITVTGRQNAEVVAATIGAFADRIKALPSAQPERLSDKDFETIRIHLNAYKEKLCNQRRWEEAKEYQRIIERFTALASAEPQRMRGRWILEPYSVENDTWAHRCGECLRFAMIGGGKPLFKYCPNCGADMREQE